MTEAASPTLVKPSRLMLCVSLLMYQLVYVGAFVGFLVWRMVIDSRYRQGVPERFGFVPASSGERPVVWIHGVSVGEVKAAGSMIQALREARPELEFVISATTPTGYALAKQLHPDLRVIRYPLDLGICPWIALRRIRPICVLLIELEVWPTFLQAAALLEVPVAVINGRMSENSYRGYRFFSRLLPQFNLIRTYCMQDEVYLRRLLSLDVQPERAEVTGNMKYDNVRLRDLPSASAGLREWLSPDDRLVLVCGSTHGEEDVWVAQAVGELAAELEIQIRIVCAPRHPERASSVRDSLIARGHEVGMWSQQAKERPPLAESEILIVDTIGHLEAFYGACDVAFVGGSLVPRGGQNMVEAAAMGKAVIFGPETSNFRTDVQLLLAADAACQVSSVADLRDGLRRLFVDEDRRRGLGERAVELIARNQGSTERTLQILLPLLRS